MAVGSRAARHPRNRGAARREFPLRWGFLSLGVSSPGGDCWLGKSTHPSIHSSLDGRSQHRVVEGVGVVIIEGVFARGDSDARGSVGFALYEATGEPSWLRMLVGELLPWGPGLLPFGCGARSAGPRWAEMKSPRRTRGLGILPVGIRVGFSS